MAKLLFDQTFCLICQMVRQTFMKTEIIIHEYLLHLHDVQIQAGAVNPYCHDLLSHCNVSLVLAQWGHCRTVSA